MHQQSNALVAVPFRSHQRRIRESDAGRAPMPLATLDAGFAAIETLSGGFTFGRVPAAIAREFIRQHEWLGTAGRASLFFGLWKDGALYGVEGFNHPAFWLARELGRDLAARTRVLSRGACCLAAGKNAGSLLIGACLRELKRQGIALVIAFADERAGELGTVYKAANFVFRGWTSAHPQYQLLVEGKWRVAGELFRQHKVSRYTHLPPDIYVDAIRPESESKRRFVRLLDPRVASALPPSWSQIAPRPRPPSRHYQPTQGSRARRAQQLATNLPPARTPGRPPKGTNNADVVRVSGSGYGNSARYRVGRLRRDHPAVAAALARGEFASVAAAWRAAKECAR